MQLGTGLPMLLIVLLLGVSHARPTFDKIAEVLLDLVDEGPYHGRPYGRPPSPHGPLIQEGYEQGYNYHYGGGGYQQQGPVIVGSPYRPPSPAYGLQPPSNSYDYYPRAPTHYRPGATTPYEYSQPTYAQGYGRGGYRQHGY
ncbi:protein lifeguard 1 [Scaptodrosophila lebanonensis]|uniref:Protein lifeguard 1 n=1 Tax=Drosophila lebanonensis TaxID=7225 RepID=A0A6J2T262_DROLE|nr:protein lifeguard 1 [Scaptodrosophila lebanonensis]